MTLYQLQTAQRDLAYKMHHDGEINFTGLISKLRKAESNLKEAVRYLVYEPIKSPEGKIAQMAMSELRMLRLSIETIEKDSILEDVKSEKTNKDKLQIQSYKKENKQFSKSNSKRSNRKK